MRLISSTRRRWRPPPSASCAEPNHHLLFAYDGAGRAVGMISGIETTHPDKGTEMFIYELGVAPAARLQGVATELVARAGRHRPASAAATACGSAPSRTTLAAQATYRKAGATEEAPFVLLNWDLMSGEPT